MEAIRYDAMTLRNIGAKEDFIRFMQEELIPDFNMRYLEARRNSRAILISQSLMVDAQNSHKFFWVTEWNVGHNIESIKGPYFQQVTMSEIPETKLILKKLEGFVKRETGRIFQKLETADAAKEEAIA